MATIGQALRQKSSNLGFRGLALRVAATAAIVSALCVLRSVPFGKYWRTNPLVFSLAPRCQGLWGALVQIAGAGKRPCCTVETSSLEHGIPHCRRKSTLDTQTPQSELSLSDAMHQFDAGDRNRRGREALEAQHRGDSLFHAPMVLLD
jgi:hypothetical protein